MTTREKILLGVSIIGVGTTSVFGYMYLGYKQAVDILIQERNASYEKPFMGFVVEKSESEE